MVLFGRIQDIQFLQKGLLLPNLPLQTISLLVERLLLLAVQFDVVGQYIVFFLGMLLTVSQLYIESDLLAWAC